MNLKRIESDEAYHQGYGAGSGRVIREVYECPCGKGKVYYEKDDIPGFRESDNYTDCSDCGELYNFRRGIATEKG